VIGEIFFLAVLSAFYPVLLVIDLVAFQARKPARLLASFLVGGLLTTLVVGVSLVSALQHTALISHGEKQSTDHVTGIVIGALALIVCLLLSFNVQAPIRGRRAGAKHREGPSWPERMLAHGMPLAFVAGVVLDILPGVFPLVGLKDIAELRYGFVGNVVAVLVFNLVMFTLVEVPLASYVLAPERTTELTTRFSGWLRINARWIGAVVLGIGGAYLLGRGLIDVLIVH
jgi:Sap, sulfolipid-1-addressing protein